MQLQVTVFTRYAQFALGVSVKEFWVLKRKKIYKAENSRMCSECTPLLPVKSPKVSPERNILFLTKFKMAAKHHVEVVIPELFDMIF